MRNHSISQGECLSSVAHQNGFFWKTLWDLPDNEALKSLRKNPNVLRPGDQVVIPDLRVKEASKAPEKRHQFRRKGVPAKLRLRLVDAQGEPRGNLRYVLQIDGKSFEGSTDGDGRIEHPMPPDALHGELTVTTDAGEERYELQLGHINPSLDDDGVEQRLTNLGYIWLPAEVTDAEVRREARRQALLSFQRKEGLNESGEADEATRRRLEEIHGS